MAGVIDRKKLVIVSLDIRGLTGGRRTRITGRCICDTEGCDQEALFIPIQLTGVKSFHVSASLVGFRSIVVFYDV